jgi:hypothetical protein
MEVFAKRKQLLEAYQLGRIELFQVTRGVLDSFDKVKQTDDPLMFAYIQYLRNLCFIERRLEIEYHFQKNNLSIEGEFGRVCGKYFREMGHYGKKIIRELGYNCVSQAFRGPKGVVILNIPNSPIGKIFMPSLVFRELKLEIIPKEQIKSRYVDIVFSFIKDVSK